MGSGAQIVGLVASVFSRLHVHAPVTMRTKIEVLVTSVALILLLTYGAECNRIRLTSQPLVEPPEGQRCSGRNYQGRRCCTPDNPCNEGEGDCDGPGDGGGHDGHRGCKGDLVCGSNNCQQFGLYFHEKDDCCEKPSNKSKTVESIQYVPGTPIEPKDGQRCAGRNYDGRRCCTPEEPCDLGEGDCDGPGDGGQHDGHLGCKGNLVCGTNNCKKFGAYYHEKDDCCEKPFAPLIEDPNNKPVLLLTPRCRGRNFDKGKCCTDGTPCKEGEGDCEVDNECTGDLVCGNNNCKDFASFFHEKDDCCIKPEKPDLRCRGRNFDKERCCTKETPCVLGEGDCDDDSDCSGNLLCGNNNCKAFGSFFHEKDDCCVAGAKTVPVSPVFPLTEPFPGQKCSGRNHQGRRCCTPENPCDEGEGDCDGPGDGGGHDGHAGCKGDLQCGSNNCRKFGLYFHEKDDCCEKPDKVYSCPAVPGGWGEWQGWSQCSASCGVGKWSRTRDCTGPSCRHRHQSQERFCNTQPCSPRL